MAARVRLAAALFCVCLLLPGCGAGVTADISAYGDTPITVSGLTDKDFTVTPGELAKLKCVRMDGTGKTAKAGTVNAVGPLLETFLAQYGKTLDDFSYIKFTAADQYAVTLGKQHLKEKDVVLSVASGSKPLTESQRPLRLFIPDAESSYWIYAVVRIDFTPKDQ
ncbi:Oxidoreductase molybdopterin binding domain-containing protein [Sporobacter termitidis DSM 10068]|uniref:Oxidoreductase molybdopterin binding domain-containing protein n=1 Tax=Sporobacter termitidis DSM 10068 TaxID=1123282 RepID=A0A1M5XE93_9FIRM|nr:molybdopterin-dependent oxidoreductase [Sporobacter termitidis]SHH97868.1 Oxidoreductase molybdopterin binding domain-containing protein [Sporobacter termitidis DSM 10068]